MLSVDEIYDLTNKELSKNEIIHVNNNMDLAIGPAGMGKVFNLRKQYPDALCVVANYTTIKELVELALNNESAQKDKVLILDEFNHLNKHDIEFLLELTANEEADYDLYKIKLLYSKIIGVITTRRC